MGSRQRLRCVLRNARHATKLKWLTFLVPKEYKLDSCPHCDYKGQVCSWEQLLGMTKRLPETALRTEFKLLLAERFGTMSFTLDETQTLFSEKLPLAEVFKVCIFVKELEKRLGLTYTVTPEKSESELGRYIHQNGKYRLYFGCYPDYTERYHAPVCFGVHESWEEDTPGLVQAFREAYPQAQLITESRFWLAHIPAEQLQEQDAVDAAAIQLSNLLSSMEKQLASAQS